MQRVLVTGGEKLFDGDALQAFSMRDSACISVAVLLLFPTTYVPHRPRFRVRCLKEHYSSAEEKQRNAAANMLQNVSDLMSSSSQLYYSAVQLWGQYQEVGRYVPCLL